MARVHHVVRKQRSQYRKMPFAAAYWLSTNLATAPRIKYGRTSYINGWASDGSVTLGTESDTSVAVTRVPGQFMGQNRPLT